MPGRLFGTKDPREAPATVVNEVRSVIDAVSIDEATAFVEAVEKAARVYVTGMGRSGLVAGSFAMRLVHLGFQSHVIGEMTAPAVRSDDLLIAISGSGATRTIIAQADAAVRAGATVAAVTALREGPLAVAVREREGPVLVIPAALGVRHRSEGLVPTAQFGGSLFEQSTLLYLDSLILVMAARRGKTESEMLSRHANLE
ncbi:MAG: SIS domain-containing protein [Planctomycetes bacterium]|nr:SIS domain-containing protein [Planctomycetota bacterium]